MAQRKRKVVFTAEPRQVSGIAEFVRAGRFASPSDFLRQAIDEKLERLRRERLERQLERYCDAGYVDEEDLIAWQAPLDDK